MTEKRFTMDNPNDWGFPITDNKTNKIYSCDSNERMKALVKVINELNDENTRLLKANTKLTEENTNLLSTIRTAYQNERTNIGRMVLKQLMEQFE